MQRVSYIMAVSMVLINITVSFPQDSLNTNLFEFSDTTKAQNTIKWLNLKNWNKYSNNDLSLKYNSIIYNFDKNRYYPSNVMPKDPFKLDYRSSSYYVPKMVKDELNLMMNRPKDSAFMPILGVAFIAAQLASKYILVQDKIKILAVNILNTLDDYAILEALWENNPQTASQLYEDPFFKKAHTLGTLKEKIELLIDNKLIKQKDIEKKEMLFFPAVSKIEYERLLKITLSENSIDESVRKKIQKIIGN